MSGGQADVTICMHSHARYLRVRQYSHDLACRTMPPRPGMQRVAPAPMHPAALTSALLMMSCTTASASSRHVVWRWGTLQSASKQARPRPAGVGHYKGVYERAEVRMGQPQPITQATMKLLNAPGTLMEPTMTAIFLAGPTRLLLLTDLVTAGS